MISRCGQLNKKKKINKLQSQTGGAGAALYQVATNHTLTRVAEMKRMGFYVNCLSAEIHTDPFFHGAGGFWELLQYAALVVCVCMCVIWLCINIYLFVLLCQICRKTGAYSIHTPTNACHRGMFILY